MGRPPIRQVFFQMGKEGFGNKKIKSENVCVYPVELSGGMSYTIPITKQKGIDRPMIKKFARYYRPLLEAVRPGFVLRPDDCCGGSSLPHGFPLGDAGAAAEKRLRCVFHRDRRPGGRLSCPGGISVFCELLGARAGGVHGIGHAPRPVPPPAEAALPVLR